jgi:adenylate kinase
MSYNELFNPRQSKDVSFVLVETGVQGSGKDFLLNTARERGAIPEEITIINFGTEIFRKLQDNNPLLKTRDDIAKLSPAEQGAAQLAVVYMILDRQPVIANAHVVYRSGDVIATNPSTDKRLRPMSFLYIWSEPDEIAQRRKNDPRPRPYESVDDIALHQDLAQYITWRLARHLGSQYQSIENRSDNVDENIDKIGELAKEIVKNKK